MAEDINNSLFSQDVLDSMESGNSFNQVKTGPVTVLGRTFANDEERRAYFREELRKKLPELKKIEGFPIGEDDDIIALSDPPYYTACPNPWLNDFIAEWEEEKKQLVAEGKRVEEKIVTEPYASDVSEGKNNAIYYAHPYHTKCPHPAIMRYILHYTEPGDIVYDGFAGTSMTGVAAGKCGDSEEMSTYKIVGKEGVRNCICGDLSPIASFIGYNFNHPVPLGQIRSETNSIISSVEKELGNFYKTHHKNGQYGVISYVLWSDVLRCDDCGHEFTFWEAALDDNMNMRDTLSCPKCGAHVDKKHGNIAKETKVNASGNVVTTPKKVPVLIRYSFQGKKYSKKPDDEDLKLIQDISDYKNPYYEPHQRIPDGVKTAELLRDGYTDISSLYTKRNLFVFSSLWEKSKDCPILRFAITAVLVKTGSLLHNVGIKDGKINLAGALPNALYVPSILAERNVFELLRGKLEDIIGIGPDKLHYCCGQVVSATDASNIADNSVDYIFTDPPFGHNLMYSELNIVHEGWLNLFTDNKEEAIENSKQNKSVNDYSDLMAKAFAEYYRILKPGRWMTVEFSNTAAAVWNALQNSLTRSGFAIALVRGLDKKQGSFNAQTTLTAVKQDLVITCYKPSEELVERIQQGVGGVTTAWDFVEDYLEHLPVHVEKDNATTSIIERSPKILYDRLITYYVQKGLQVPIDASDFQIGLRERYSEEDGMFFTPSQLAEYREKKKLAPEFVSMGLIVSSESDGIEWLRNRLRDNPQTYQDIQPDWLQAIGGLRRGDILPGLDELLEENFIQENDGKWRLPNIQDDVDKDKLREKALLKEFKIYVEAASKPRARIKEVRVDAIRAGFKKCYIEKDFATIVNVSEKIPQNLVNEDEIIYQFYEIALGKM